jgi:hypothetical protein
MSQENKGVKTFTATEALEAYRRVKLTTGSGTAVEYADAGAEFIGFTAHKVAIGEMVSVNLRSASKTYKAVAAEVLAVGAVLYGADDGKVQDTVSGTAQGTALEAATADGDIIEILSNNGAAGAIGPAAVIDEAANEGVIPIIIRKVCNFVGDYGAEPIDVATAARKLRILDWWIRSLDTTAANITVKNAGTSISTAALAKGTVNDAIVRAATIVEAQAEVASGAAITAESSVSSVGVELTIIAVPIA